jgi:hypothetical protein
MTLVVEDIRLVKGGGGESLVIRVRAGAIRVSLLTDMCLALLLLVEFLLFFLPFLVLFLVILIIGTLCKKMTGLTTFEAHTLSN